MTTYGYNIYFDYFHRVENSMKTIGEYWFEGPFDYEFDHNRNLRKILIDAYKGL